MECHNKFENIIRTLNADAQVLLSRILRHCVNIIYYPKVRNTVEVLSHAA